MTDSKAHINTRLKMVRLELGLSSGEFAQKSNIDPRNYSSIETGKRTVGERVLKDICAAFPINLSWLLTGEGEMLVGANAETAVLQPVVESAYMVPLLSLDVVGGSKNEISDTKEYIIGHMPFVEGRKGDYAIAVSGTSMYPTIPPGSVVLMRAINWRDYIEYGQVYVIDLQDDRRIIKEVRRCYDDPHKIIIYSHNPDAGGEQVIPLSLVRNMFLVKAQYQRTSM